MIKFIHQLLNPHCSECDDLRRESEICDSCEILKQQLELVTIERDKLLNIILDKPVEINEIKLDELKPIQSNRFLPWAARRQMMERDDRIKASQAKDKSVEKLEEEVLGKVDG